ncbi:hypothetical protein GLYMA_01G197000v4 [Glycine max]|uniref:Uncharacterized protein n=2 Tax=Glycine subgen. Soja TaxID=1462606 RepID=A0A0R0LHM2_SOYBN|nr:hypothetical protein JHK87_002316 [Glycine soja]KAG5070004.1 hypothetical protein JHK85_002381 [Glycine max]KAG5089709.1 hypothetical protein JHK86_002321 [Glycine max]KAH1163953.1 hypothetical protein GYH30_002137 [Glycine max]KRH77177.1 hypothetical protein GLYMA_01G197000v4 [Glycine max]
MVVHTLAWWFKVCSHFLSHSGSRSHSLMVVYAFTLMVRSCLHLWFLQLNVLQHHSHRENTGCQEMLE